MTKKEAIMAMYVSALPVVLQDWFTAYAAPDYSGEVVGHGADAVMFMKEFIATYTEAAIKQANQHSEDNV